MDIITGDYLTDRKHGGGWSSTSTTRPTSETKKEEEKRMITAMIATLMLLACAAKKNEPRWLQMTLDGGTAKRRLNWMNKNDEICPSHVEVGQAHAFEKAGYDVPFEHFKDLSKNAYVALMFPKDAPNESPLFISQKTALTSLGNWLQSTKGEWEIIGDIDRFTPKSNLWRCQFVKTGGKQTSPFAMAAGEDQE